MTDRTQRGDALTKRGRWQRLWSWLHALERAVEYDPMEHMEARVRDLAGEVARLDARIDALDADRSRQLDR